VIALGCGPNAADWTRSVSRRSTLPAHIDFLETQVDLIGRIGLDLYTQSHVGELEGEH